MARVSRQFQRLIEEIVAAPHRRISEYSLLDPAERHSCWLWVVRRPGFQNGEHGRDHVRLLLQAQSRHHSGPESLGPQSLGELSGLFFQPAISERLAIEYHCVRRWCFQCLRFKQFMDIRLWPLRRRAGGQPRASNWRRSAGSSNEYSEMRRCGAATISSINR